MQKSHTILPILRRQKKPSAAIPRKVSALAGSIALLGSLLHGQPLHAATVTWDNSDGTNDWSTAANWNPDTEPLAADDVVLPVGLAATLTLSAGELANTLTFNDNYTLTGGTITLSPVGGITVTAGKGLRRSTRSSVAAAP